MNRYAELYSAYLYLDFAIILRIRILMGMQTGIRSRRREERDHALLFMQYMQNNGERVVFDAIKNLSVS